MKEIKPTTTKRIKITPSMATEMLRTNPKCDDLDEKRIQKYARKMDSGHWKWNDTPIVFAKDGTPLKGRHRLWGVFEAGIPVEFLVAYEAA